LLFEKLLQPGEYNTKEAEESLQERISEYESCVKRKIEMLLETDPNLQSPHRSMASTATLLSL
jgi:hypothetical protein